MARLNPRLWHSGEFTTVKIRADIDDDEWSKLLSFCESPDNPGEYDWTLGIQGSGIEFMISDPNMAFEFRMRYS